MKKNKYKILHILYRFSYGGLEFVLVNMINSMSDERFTHVIASMKDYSSDMYSNLRKPVDIFTLDKKEGKDVGYYFRLRKLIKEIRPDVIHTYNIGAIDSIISGIHCGVKAFVHSEHGRDVSDPLGENKKYNFIRKILAPLFSEFIVVSDELKTWLSERVCVNQNKISVIYNGVDTQRYRPFENKLELKKEFFDTDAYIIGSVGRLDRVKNHVLLVEAFSRVKQRIQNKNMVLIIIGEGPARDEIQEKIKECGVSDSVILTGARNDIARVMPLFDLYVQSSVAEGIPMTVLEAMSCGIPVLSTDVGGISEVIKHGIEGHLIPSNNLSFMQEAMEYMLEHPEYSSKLGLSARDKILKNYSLVDMGNQYSNMYLNLLDAINN